MKIQLEYPYSNDWKHGYLVTNPEGRQTIILYNSNTDRSSTAYARYLMAVKEGRYLTEDEEVDHINADHTDDSKHNLQILSVDEHKEKTNNEQSGQTYHSFICACCGITFQRSAQRTHRYTKYCGVGCSRKMATLPHNKTIDYNKVQELIDKGLNDTEIAKQLSINKNSVLNYRQKNNIPSVKFTTSRILEENITDIESMLKNKVKKVDIMKKYGVSKNTLARFLSRNNM